MVRNSNRIDQLVNYGCRRSAEDESRGSNRDSCENTGALQAALDVSRAADTAATADTGGYWILILCFKLIRLCLSLIVPAVKPKSEDPQGEARPGARFQLTLLHRVRGSQSVSP